MIRSYNNNYLIIKKRQDDFSCVDVLVYSLDRLGRTSKELTNLLSEFKERGIQFKSLQEGVFDTTSAMGEAVFQIITILKAISASTQ